MFTVVCPHLCSHRNSVHATSWNIKIQRTTQCDDAGADVNAKQPRRGGRLRREERAGKGERRRREWERGERGNGRIVMSF